MASRRERERLLLCGGRVRVCLCVCVCISVTVVRQWKFLAPNTQSVRGGARGEEPVASASGSVRDRGEGEDLLIVCCVPLDTAHARCLVESILRTPRSLIIHHQTHLNNNTCMNTRKLAEVASEQSNNATHLT